MRASILLYEIQCHIIIDIIFVLLETNRYVLVVRVPLWVRVVLCGYSQNRYADRCADQRHSLSVRFLKYVCMLMVDSADRQIFQPE